MTGAGRASLLPCGVWGTTFLCAGQVCSPGAGLGVTGVFLVLASAFFFMVSDLLLMRLYFG